MMVVDVVRCLETFLARRRVLLATPATICLIILTGVPGLLPHHFFTHRHFYDPEKIVGYTL